MRVFAVSDLHVDYESNRKFVSGLSDYDYRDDVLLVAGDVTHCLDQFASAFHEVTKKYRAVFFVPGNHDLWVRRNEAADSREKFWQLRELCRVLNVMTTPMELHGGNRRIGILPLFSWYSRPEDGIDSLYLPSVGDDPALRGWGDTHLIRWKTEESGNMLDYFLFIQAQKVIQHIT